MRVDLNPVLRRRLQVALDIAVVILGVSLAGTSSNHLAIAIGCVAIAVAVAIVVLTFILRTERRP